MTHRPAHDYEYPLNELMRLALRLEYLVDKAVHFIEADDAWGHRIALETQLDLLTLLDRTDLRHRLAQETARHLETLKRLTETPQVNHAKCRDLIHTLENVHNRLHLQQGKFAEDLRQNEFLQSINQYRGVPGGTHPHITPAYYLWSTQSVQSRRAQLRSWLHSFDEIMKTNQTLLSLVRNSAVPLKKVAAKGHFQTALDPQAPAQLIRVSVDTHYQVFPTMSLGRHGATLYFHDANLETRAKQTSRDIAFELAVCIF